MRGACAPRAVARGISRMCATCCYEGMLHRPPSQHPHPSNRQRSSITLTGRPAAEHTHREMTSGSVQTTPKPIDAPARLPPQQSDRAVSERCRSTTSNTASGRYMQRTRAVGISRSSFGYRLPRSSARGGRLTTVRYALQHDVVACEAQQRQASMARAAMRVRALIQIAALHKHLLPRLGPVVGDLRRRGL